MSINPPPPPWKRLNTTIVAFNINHTIRFRLTEVGRQLLQDENLTHLLTPGYSTEEKPDGWCKWQLWLVMKTFGPAIDMGMSLPFEANIQLFVEIV